MKRSKLGSLHLGDWAKGLLIAVLSGVCGAGVDIIKGGGVIDANALNIAMTAGISGGMAYILKQLSTNSQGQLLIKEKTE